MKNKITKNNSIYEEFKEQYFKMRKKRQNAIFFTPPNLGYSCFFENDKLRNFINSETKIPKISNITNNTIQKGSKEDTKKQNISIACGNINKFLKNDIPKKMIDKNIKIKFIHKIRKNIKSLNMPKKSHSKSRKKSLNNNLCFSGRKKIINNNYLLKTINTTFIYSDYKRKYNDYYKSFVNNNRSIHNKSFKIDFNKFKTDKIINKTKTNIINNIKNKQNNNNKQSIQLKEKEKEKNIKPKHNNNNSSKFTNTSSYITSEKNIVSRQTVNDISKQDNPKSYINIDVIKENFLLKLKTDLNDNETQEYESKFLNYELGIISDKVSKQNNNYLDEPIKSREKVQNECEKPVEDIEKIANEIFNSGYINKRISYIKDRIMNIEKINKINPSKDIGLSNDIDELKEGEEIQNVFSLYIHKKTK